ncbi:MAG: sigma-E factor negative regulatory protein [Burkholderiales bacterium]
MQEEDDKADISQRLSALADGELDAEAVGVACAHWRDDGQSRATWHTFHLIGDVLRSDALASDAGHDERFLRRLRERLAAEPAVLAPQPLSMPLPPARRASVRWTWLAPAAVAAGFVAVASVLVVTRGTLPATGGEGAVMASATAPSRTVMATAAPARAAGPIAAGEALVPPQALVADRQFVRDARLDRYLAAHMEFGGSSALGAPSGFLRAATSRTPDR